MCWATKNISSLQKPLEERICGWCFCFLPFEFLLGITTSQLAGMLGVKMVSVPSDWDVSVGLLAAFEAGVDKNKAKDTWPWVKKMPTQPGVAGWVIFSFTNVGFLGYPVFLTRRLEG